MRSGLATSQQEDTMCTVVSVEMQQEVSAELSIPSTRKLSVAGSDLSGHRMPTTSDFCENGDFLTKQRSLRDTALSESGGQKVLMLSHCNRNASIQPFKRKLMACIGLNGFAYWSDFLDLHAAGPISWRSSIEEGIRDCAKVVLFVDQAYLLSFNCLQEVALAQEHSKPMVVIILEQDAIELLTKPDGADSAWDQLRDWEGKQLTPDMGSGRPFSHEELRALFELLSSINFCMCRGLDLENDTERVVLRRMIDFIAADLAYQREHAKLQTRAMEWEARAEAVSLLLHGEAVGETRGWVQRAQREGRAPPPTALQRRFVEASARRATRATRLLQALSGLAVLLIVGAAIAAGVQWARAVASEGLAQASAAEALQQAGAALANQQRADSEAARARGEAAVSRAWLLLFYAKTDRSLNGFAQAAIREAQALAPALPAGMVRQVQEDQSLMAREIERRTVGYPVFRWTPEQERNLEGEGPEAPPMHDPRAGAITGGEVSTDGRWIAVAADGEVVVKDTARNEVMRVTVPRAGIVALAWRGDGEGLHLVALDARTPRVLRFSFAPRDGQGTRDSSHEAGSDRRGSAAPQEIDGGLEWAMVPPLPFRRFVKRGPTPISAVFSADATRVLVGFHSSGQLVLFEVTSGTEFVIEDIIKPRLGPIAWSSDGRFVARARDDVLLWDMAQAVTENTPAETLRNHGTVLDLAFAPDGQRLLGQTADGNLVVWSFGEADGARGLAGAAAGIGWGGAEVLGVTEPVGTKRAAWEWVQWSGDGARVAAMDGVHALHVFDAASGELEAVMHAEGEVIGVRWADHGEKVYVVASQDAATVTAFQLEKARQSAVMEGHQGAVTSLRFSGEDCSFWSASPEDMTLRRWSAVDETSDVVLQGKEFLSVDVSRDGTRVATIDSDGVLAVLDVATGVVRELGRHPEAGEGSPLAQYRLPTNAFEVQWSPNGGRLVTSFHTSTTLMVWNADADAPQDAPPAIQVEVPGPGSSPRGWRRMISAPAWAPGGREVAVLVSAEDETQDVDPPPLSRELMLLDVDSGAAVSLSSQDDVQDSAWGTALTFSPDGARLAVVNARMVHLWRRKGRNEGGEAAWAWQHVSFVGSVSGAEWTPDGKRLLVVSPDSVLRAFDVLSGDCSPYTLAVGIEGHHPRLALGHCPAPSPFASGNLGADGRDQQAEGDPSLSASQLEATVPVMGVTDGKVILGLSDQRSHAEVIRRHSADITPAELEQYYGISNQAEPPQCLPEADQPPSFKPPPGPSQDPLPGGLPPPA